MEVAVFVPTLVLAVAFALSILLYSVRKVFGPGVLSFWQKSQVSEDGEADLSQTGGKNAEEEDLVLSGISLGLMRRFPVRELRWCIESLSVQDKMTGKPKNLLQKCKGSCVPGDMVALMGPSGAGKSSMLDCLFMRPTGGRLQGSIMLDDDVVTSARPGKFRMVSTYVPQEDNFVPTLSVSETLMFFANLRLPAKLTKLQKEELVKETLNNMGLKKVKDSQVGGLLPGGLNVRGLSGGEKRRLSIACGIVGAPRIIALDEPTSGLDSNAALVVMQCMKRLAKQGDGRIVIASIHQPRAAIWELFNKVQVLSEGHSLYFGPRQQVTNWFQNRLNFDYDPLHHGNTAEWLADLVSISFNKPSPFFKRTMRTIKDVQWAAMEFAKAKPELDLLWASYKDPENEVEGTYGGATAYLDVGFPGKLDPLDAMERQITPPRLEPAPQEPDHDAPDPGQVIEDACKGMHNTGFWNQYKVLQRRAFQAYTRNPLNVAGRTLMAIFIGLIGGWVFMKDAGGEEHIRQMMSAIFFQVLVLALVPFTYMSMFVSDRSFFMRDPARSLYSTGTYYLSVMTVNAAVTIINAAILVLIMYGMIGLRYTDKAVLATAAIGCLHSLVAVQALVLCAFITPNQDLAFVLAVSYDVLSSLLGGVWVHIGNLVGVLKGVSFISFFRYTINAFVNLQYADRDDGCGVMPVITQQQRQAAAAAMQHGGSAPHFPTGRESCNSVLTSTDMQLSMGGCIGGLCVLLVVLHVASFVALKRQTKRG